jgi:hypothetical protein
MRNFEDIGIGGRIILKWIFTDDGTGRGGVRGQVSHRSGKVQVVGTCECGNEHSGPTKCKA